MPAYVSTEPEHALPLADLLPVAKTVMDLLGISDGQNVSLILGFPIGTTNRWAVAHWIRNYLIEHPERDDFRKYIFPEFSTHLANCRASLPRIDNRA